MSDFYPAHSPLDLSNEDKMKKFALFVTLNDKEKQDEFGFTKQYQFAETYGLTEKTLSLWKNHTEKFKRYRRELLIATKLDDRLPSILERMVERASEDGDVNAAKEIFKIAGLSKETVEILSDQRIKEILGQIVTIIQDEVKDPLVLNRIAKRFADLDV